MEFNEDKLRKLTSELVSALKQLKDLGNLTKEEFKNDPHKIGNAKYQFIVVIEVAIDMCNHLISQNSLRTPEDYADTFRVMGDAGAFPNDFIETLIKIAKFRNRLVHLYWEVNNEELYRILKENFGDLDQFLSYFGQFIKKEGSPL